MEGVSGPPPSMVKSGISTIEDLSKDELCAGGLHGTPETSTVTTVAASENEVKAATDVETPVTNSSKNSGKTIPDVAIVLVHNH